MEIMPKALPSLSSELKILGLKVSVSIKGTIGLELVIMLNINIRVRTILNVVVKEKGKFRVQANLNDMVKIKGKVRVRTSSSDMGDLCYNCTKAIENRQ